MLHLGKQTQWDPDLPRKTVPYGVSVPVFLSDLSPKSVWRRQIQSDQTNRHGIATRSWSSENSVIAGSARIQDRAIFLSAIFLSCHVSVTSLKAEKWVAEECNSRGPVAPRLGFPRRRVVSAESVNPARIQNIRTTEPMTVLIRMQALTVFQTVKSRENHRQKLRLFPCDSVLLTFHFFAGRKDFPAADKG